MSDKKPFNDVIDHMNKIEGSLSSKVKLKKLPRPLRYFSYVMLGFFGISVILMIVNALLD